MLWVYFDRQGVAKCMVNAGNKIRQGDSFELAVYLEGTNEGASAGWEVQNVSWTVAAEKEPHSVQSAIQSRSETFRLNDPSKANFYFADGKAYKVWVAEIDEEATEAAASGTDKRGGHVAIVITLADSSTGAQKRNEVISAFVEPTYGSKPTRMTSNDYDRLISLYTNYDPAIVHGSGECDAQQRGGAKASGTYSFAAGKGTVADSEGMAALGRYNASGSGALLAIGNGMSDADRKDAFRVLPDGRARIQTAPSEAMDVANKDYVDKKACLYSDDDGYVCVDYDKI